VKLGRNVIVGGRNSSLWTHNRQETAPIDIGDFCYLGSEARLAPGAKLPDECILGLGSVLAGEITEPRSLVAGVPAKVVRPLSEKDLARIHRKTRRDMPDDYYDRAGASRRHGRGGAQGCRALSGDPVGLLSSHHCRRTRCHSARHSFEQHGGERGGAGTPRALPGRLFLPDALHRHRFDGPRYERLLHRNRSANRFHGQRWAGSRDHPAVRTGEPLSAGWRTGLPLLREDGLAAEAERVRDRATRSRGGEDTALHRGALPVVVQPAEF
jgi:hypothetical protein